MFGLLRTVLACIVVVQHAAGVRLVGTLAVASFFVLSGFLMTLLMDGPYRSRPIAFAVNRVVRLYPAYWVTGALVAALLIAGIPSPRPTMGLPQTWLEWVRNILYINYSGEPNTLVLTAWAVTNEMAMYALIALGISKTATRSLIWLFASIVFSVSVFYFADINSDLRYFSPLAASLPFSVGAVAYHLRSLVSRPLAYRSLTAAGLVVGAATMAAYSARLGPSPQALWIAYLLATVAIVLGLYWIGEEIPRRWAKLDALVGVLSYPIYLNHFAAMAIVLAWGQLVRASPAYTVAVIAGSMAIATLTYLAIDRPIERLRTIIRKTK